MQVLQITIIGEHVQIEQTIQIQTGQPCARDLDRCKRKMPPRKHYLDPANHTDHTGKQKITNLSTHLADYTDPTPENINVCAKHRSFRSHLGKRVRNKSWIMGDAPGRNVNVCSSASFIPVQLTQGNTYMRGNNTSIVSTPGSAEELLCCPPPRSCAAAEPLELLLPPTSAVPTLMLCFSST